MLINAERRLSIAFEAAAGTETTAHGEFFLSPTKYFNCIAFVIANSLDARVKNTANSSSSLSKQR